MEKIWKFSGYTLSSAHKLETYVLGVINFAEIMTAT